MSNNELRKLNERQRLESQYKQQNSKTRYIVRGIAAVTTAAGVIGAASKIKKEAPGLLKSGKSIVDKARYQKWLFMHR